MDLNRSSHINKTDEDIVTEDLPNRTDKQSNQPPENGELELGFLVEETAGVFTKVFISSAFSKF